MYVILHTTQHTQTQTRLHPTAYRTKQTDLSVVWCKVLVAKHSETNNCSKYYIHIVSINPENVPANNPYSIPIKLYTYAAAYIYIYYITVGANAS
jgi:hypothetical protein